MSKKTFRDRLRRIINELGLNDSEFASAGNISRATLSGYFNTDRLPKQDTLSLWVDKFQLDANWLLTGKGDIFLNQDVDAPDVKKCKQSSNNEEGVEGSSGFIDPIAERIKTTTDVLERSGASPEFIQQAIMKILDSQNEPHTQAEETLSTPAFANDRGRSIKQP